MPEFDPEIVRKRRFRFAVGYMIEQEGTETVERIIRDGTLTRFGVRQSWIPGRDLDSLTRKDAEELLKEREWDFRDYNKIRSLITPAKIFDTHILFSFETAVSLAQRALNLDEVGGLNRQTRRKIEETPSQEFLPRYIDDLEFFTQQNFDEDIQKPILKRVRRIPYRNVNASDTSI